MCLSQVHAGRLVSREAGLSLDFRTRFVDVHCSKEEDIAALMDEAVKRFGTLDCAVNNAGRMQQNNRIPFWEVALYL